MKQHKLLNTNRTNTLTKEIIRYLVLSGWYVWRQNNVAAPNRKFRGIRGVPDILGFNVSDPRYCKGTFIGIEVKMKGDKLSIFQEAFKQKCEKGGAVYIEARSIEDIIAWRQKTKSP